MILTALAFAKLATACSPGDAVRTLASVASVESGLHPWAIHDNTTTETLFPDSRDQAVSIATRLISGERHSVDLGLMQIESANLTKLGLTVSDAFDPCRSIAAGATVLRQGYTAALRVAFSRYNTGTSDRGFTNGYVQRVELTSLRLPDISKPDRAAGQGLTTPLVQSPAPPPTAVDLLHGEKIEAASGEVVNLLPETPVLQAVQPQSRSRMSAAVPGQAVD